MVHIPEGSHLSALYAVKYLSKTCSIGVYTVGLYQQCNIVLLSNRNKLLQCLYDILIINIASGCRLKIAEYSYVRSTELACKLSVSLDLVLSLLILVLELQAGTRRKTGYLQPERAELCNCIG